MVKVTIPYNFVPREYQVPLYNCITDGYKRGCAVWHRRAGKDKTLINIIAREAFKAVGTYFYVFPYYSQGRKVLWDGMDKGGFKFLHHIPPALVKTKNSQEMKLTLANSSIIQVVGSDNIDTIVGTNPLGVVFSEYSIQRPEAWDYIRPILLENKGWALFNFTPRGHNHAFALYNLAQHSKDWFCQKLTVEDTKVIGQEDIQRERNEGLSESMIQQEYYCSFEADQSNQLIPFSILDAAVKRKLLPQVYNTSPIIVGVDVARFGDDRSVICVRQGLHVHEIRKYKDVNTMELVSLICMAIDEYHARYTFVDAVGIGAGVCDRLRQLGRSVIEVMAGSKASDPKYYNLKAEFWCKYKEWLIQGGSIPDDKDLITESSTQVFEYSNANSIKLWTKQKMKAEGMPSPDVAEALCHTFAYPVSPTSSPYYEEEDDYDEVIRSATSGRNTVTGY